jgi:hypothetical protein
VGHIKRNDGGGLGVLDMGKYYLSSLPHAKISYCSFWWRDCSKLFPDFKQLLVFFCPRNENSIVIWQGAWLKDIRNIVFSFAHFPKMMKYP